MADSAIRRHRPDYQIAVFMGVLLLIGVVTLATISPARAALTAANGSSISATLFLEKQLAYLGFGLLAFGVMSVAPLAFLQKYAAKILIGAFAICALLFLVGNLLHSSAAVCTLGACRWINVGFGTFQPAELVKFGFILFASGFLAMKIKSGKLNDLRDTMAPLGIIVAISLFFIVIVQKDLGTGLTFIGILASMLFVAGINRRTAMIAGGLVLAALVLFTVTQAHRIDRVLTFLQPDTASNSSTYQIEQAKIALGSGGVLGVGLGKSVQAFGYLPEAINDSIFAIMGELFGFAGLLAIMALLFMLLIRILKVMDTTNDMRSRLLVAGVFGWIATHTIVNIAAMTGVFPLTGITLPLLSFGGTSMLFIMMGLGLVFGLSRYTTHERISDKERGTSDENSRSRRGLRGPRYAGTGSTGRY
jgi:cell division protein FtsW